MTRHSVRVMRSVCVALMAMTLRAEAQERRGDPVAEAPFRLGPAGVAPSVALSNLGVDGNVFNSTTDPQKDFTVTATPGARVWLRTERGLLSLEGRADLVYYATYTSERSMNPFGSIAYEYPFLRVRPFVSYSVLNSKERSGYEIDLRIRRVEDTVRAGGVFPIGSVSAFEVARRHDRIKFDEDVDVDGPVSQTLDRTRDAWDAQWRQELTSLTTWLVEAAHEQERFDFESRRNSDSVRIRSGFELNPLALIRGKALIGYRHLRSAEGGTLAEFSGMTADVNIAYTAPSQTRVELAVTRDLHYSLHVDQPYYVQTGLTVVGTQRVFRQWDVRVTGGRDLLDYTSVNGGDGPHDRISRIGVGVGLEIRDDVRVGFDVSLQQRLSPLETRGYRAYKSGVSVTYGN
jgi:hypothetical protein